MNEAQTQSSHADLASLLDERDIVKVVNRYCFALDTKDWADLDNVFLPNATADLSTPTLLVGREAIVDRIRAALHHLDDSQHLVGNHQVTIDGDSATHRCYLQAQHVRHAAVGGPNYIIGGRYEDQLLRTADGWRIAHRTLAVMWKEGNLAVTQGDAQPAPSSASVASTASADQPTNPTPTADQLLITEACREAARRYSYGIDRLDVDVMKSAYWPDATDDHGLFVGNAWEFCDRVVSTHDRWTWTMHSIFNHRIDIDPDGKHARGEMYNVSCLFNEKDRVLSTWYGRYLDTYQRRGDEWRIHHRVCVHNGDTNQHVPESMGIDAAKFRQASFDRPANRRPIGP